MSKPFKICHRDPSGAWERIVWPDELANIKDHYTAMLRYDAFFQIKPSSLSVMVDKPTRSNSNSYYFPLTFMTEEGYTKYLLEWC